MPTNKILAWQKLLNMIKELYLITLLWLGLLSPAASQPAKRGYNWQGRDRFYLSAPFFSAWGLTDILPFGFRLTPRSQLRLVTPAEGQQESYFVATSKPVPFDSVRYSLGDGVVRKVELKGGGTSGAARRRICEVLDHYFGKADFANEQEAVYSNEQLLAVWRLQTQSLVVQSLDHQALTEQSVPGYRFYKDEGRFWFSISENEAVGLEFYNQLTRENNVQLAFRLHFKGPAPVDIRQICFQLAGGQHLRLAVTTTKAEGLTKVSRCFLYEREAQKIAASSTVRVLVVGRRRVSYRLPAYQKHSLKTALQFYKENVTNPLVMYSGW